MATPRGRVVGIMIALRLRATNAAIATTPITGRSGRIIISKLQVILLDSLRIKIADLAGPAIGRKIEKGTRP